MCGALLYENKCWVNQLQCNFKVMATVKLSTFQMFQVGLLTQTSRFIPLEECVFINIYWSVYLTDWYPIYPPLSSRQLTRIAKLKHYSEIQREITKQRLRKQPEKKQQNLKKMFWILETTSNPLTPSVNVRLHQFFIEEWSWLMHASLFSKENIYNVSHSHTN